MKILDLRIFIILNVTLLIVIPSYSQNFNYQSAYQPNKDMAIFYPAKFKPHETLPSFIFKNKIDESNKLDQTWKIRPIFQKIDGKNAVTIKFDRPYDFYGTGEVIGSLRRNDTNIKLWNTDNYCYEKDNGKRLYQSHPWVMGVDSNGKSIGIIADHTWKQSIEISDEINMISEGPPFRVIVIKKDNPLDLIKELSMLTGTIDLPPLWALGFQQCKYSYFPDDRVKEIADKFREYQIPCDVIWMDIDYMDGYRVFTFDKNTFPNPKELNTYLHKKDFKAVYMIDPGVKNEKGYFVYDSGSKGDHWVKTSKNKDFTGDVWPGSCVFPDFTIPETVSWWESLYTDFMNLGIDGVWNDMNEPAVFDGPDGTMPIDNWHRGGDTLPPGPHLRYHNVYGLLMVKSSRSGIMKVNPNKRPFVLSRANFLGGQKYAATWTGDNKSTWEHMKLSIPMSLSLSLSGQPFNGPDIGGFEGNCNKDLLGHWMALGAFYPFSRNHSSNNSVDQEPWAFGEDIISASRTALNRRYMLLPYIYTEFYNASKNGSPIMRPTFFADFKDLELRDEEQSFLLGNDLLIIPRWASNLDLPQGDWDQLKLQEDTDIYQPILLQRPGSIIPMSGKIQSTVDYNTDNITLLVNPDENGNAYGELYHDDGDGYDYKSGNFSLTSFKCTLITNSLHSVEIKKIDGDKIDTRHYRIGLVEDGKIYYSNWSKNSKIVFEKDLNEHKKINDELFPSMFLLHKKNKEQKPNMIPLKYQGDSIWISNQIYFEKGSHDIFLSRSKKLDNALWGNASGLEGKLNSFKGLKNRKPLNFKINEDENYVLIFNQDSKEYKIRKASEYNYIGMVGDATSFGWNPIGIPMENIVINPGVFFWRGQLKKGELKFHTCSGDWNEGDWIHPLSQHQSNINSPCKIYANNKGPDNKWLIGEDGLYEVKVDLNEKMVSIKLMN